MSVFPWPAFVSNLVPGATGVPCNDSAIAQKHVATCTPRIFPARTHAKEKQLANVAPGTSHVKKDVAVCFLPLLQLFISCGMFVSSENSDHMPSSPIPTVGGVPAV